MKLFPVRGGIHPDYRKGETSEKPIVSLPMPATLYVPLQQHIGVSAEPLVAAGDRVLKGQRIAGNQGSLSIPQHAPTSGTIRSVGEITAPHPSGLPQSTIILEPDGKDEWAELPPRLTIHCPPIPISFASAWPSRASSEWEGQPFPLP